MMGYIFLSLAIFGTTAGQLFLKKHHTLGENFFSVNFLFAIILFMSVPIFIYLSLEYLNFIIVFLSDAIVITIIVIFSTIFLKEKIYLEKIIGVILIVLGIFIINWRMI